VDRVCAGRASEAKKPSTQTKQTKKLVRRKKIYVNPKTVRIERIVEMVGRGKKVE